MQISNIQPTSTLKNSLHPITILVFLTLVILSVIFISLSVYNRTEIEKLKMEQTISEKSESIKDTLSKLLYKTEALSSLIIQNNGTINNFERLAKTIVNNPAILNVLVAPDGIVSNVYPLEGNEGVIGLNFFNPGNGNAEAILAKETGQLVFGGPFKSVQGHEVLVGRLPVYVGENFWGLVSVTLKYSEVLDTINLLSLEENDFIYQIWRINPDTDEKQIIHEGSAENWEDNGYIEKEISIINAKWIFKIAPKHKWYEYSEIKIQLIFCFIASILLTFMVHKGLHLKRIKDRMIDIAHRDVLTGIHNRRFFLENVPIKLNKSENGNKSYIIIFDIDFFKKVNDTYGHSAGDYILKSISALVKSIIRPCDLFARYGGEEFILLIPVAGKNQAYALSERIREKICNSIFEYEDIKIKVSASFGIAECLDYENFEGALKNADKALYRAKADGRNKVVVSN